MSDTYYIGPDYTSQKRGISKNTEHMSQLKTADVGPLSPLALWTQDPFVNGPETIVR